MKITLKHIEDGDVIVKNSVQELLDFVNDGHSEQWNDYDETDWEEGLEFWEGYKVVSIEENGMTMTRQIENRDSEWDKVVSIEE